MRRLDVRRGVIARLPTAYDFIPERRLDAVAIFNATVVNENDELALNIDMPSKIAGGFLDRQPAVCIGCAHATSIHGQPAVSVLYGSLSLSAGGVQKYRQPFSC